MKKIVIFDGYGGFGISPEMMREYLKRKGKDAYFYILMIEEKDMGYQKCKCEDLSEGDIWLVFTEDCGNEIANRRNASVERISGNDIERDDKNLIKVVKWGKKKGDAFAKDLKIVEIPDDVEWQIERGEGGGEWIAEKHRIWC